MAGEEALSRIHDGSVIGVTLGANTRERVVNTIVDNTDPPLYP